MRGVDEAVRRWITGAATGDWSDLIEMIHPDVTFHVPVAGFEGVQHGIAAARRFFDRIAATIRADLTVERSFAADPARAGFEVAVAGTRHGEPFRQRLFLVFDVRDGRVHEFREYLAWPGGLRP
jgi:ketosteroid isomerase-like protein